MDIAFLEFYLFPAACIFCLLAPSQLCNGFVAIDIVQMPNYPESLMKRPLCCFVVIVAWSLCVNSAFSGMCEAPSSSSAIAIPFEYYVTQDKGRWITLSATSSDIEWNSLNEGWPTRYKKFKYGGSGAIIQWQLDTVPAHGIVYENSTALAAGDTITDPDDLFYTPDLGYAGTDTFAYCVTDASGCSNIANVTMRVVSAANYPMPIGIPDPGFGINEEPPADPSGWPESEVTGWYYIDSDHPSCSDSNTYGCPDAPRCSIARDAVVAAGHKMVLASSTLPYPLDNFGWHRIYLNGRAGNPAWLVGDDRNPAKPTIAIHASRVGGTEFRVEGDNYRISGIDFDGVNFNNRGLGNNIVLRYARCRNNPSQAGGGTSVGLSSDGPSENVLAFHVNAHDNGIVHPTLGEERDIHAFVGSNQRNFWMIDIVCSENAGDCVQLTNHNTTENVYVGRAVMHSMMENGIDIKDFNKFVVSESDCWDIRTVSYGSGSGGNAQNFYVNDEGVQQNYGYFINNRSWDTNGQNFSAANVSGRVYFIGNRAFFSPAGIGLASMNGGGERHFYFNTIHDVQDGVFAYTAGSTDDRFFAGNYVGNAGRYGTFVAAAYANLSGLDYNVYNNSNQFAWGSDNSPSTGDFAAFNDATGFETNAILDAAHDFFDETHFDFRIGESSQLRDIISTATLGSVAPGIAAMQSDLSIEFVDFNNTTRSDGLLDIGADEYGDDHGSLGQDPEPEPAPANSDADSSSGCFIDSLNQAAQ